LLLGGVVVVVGFGGMIGLQVRRGGIGEV